MAIKTLPGASEKCGLVQAKLLGSLNHPNIGAVYGLEEDNGTRFLILELVEGDTLATPLNMAAARWHPACPDRGSFLLWILALSRNSGDRPSRHQMARLYGATRFRVSMNRSAADGMPRFPS